MSEQDQAKKFADKSATIANETLAKGKAAAEQSAQAALENLRDYNLKMIDMARTNIESVFEFASQFATAKQPSDMVELWTTHAKKQFETLSEQVKELSALGQKIAGESAAQLTRAGTQTFKKAS